MACDRVTGDMTFSATVTGHRVTSFQWTECRKSREKCLKLNFHASVTSHPSPSVESSTSRSPLLLLLAAAVQCDMCDRVTGDMTFSATVTGHRVTSFQWTECRKSREKCLKLNFHASVTSHPALRNGRHWKQPPVAPHPSTPPSPVAIDPLPPSPSLPP